MRNLECFEGIMDVVLDSDIFDILYLLKLCFLFFDGSLVVFIIKYINLRL